MRDDFADRYGPWAVIAGASEGIGECFARRVAAAGVRPVLVARNEAKLRALADDLPVESRVAAVDLTAPDVLDALAPALDGIDVGLLVYNAGADPFASQFLDQPLESWAGLVRRNVGTVLAACHFYGSAMAARGRGGIVLVTSGAAWAGGAYIAAYSASKAFDLILGEALWAELHPLGVDVLSMVLGPTDTPAFRRVLHGRDFEGIADPDDVARHLLDNVAEGPTWPPDGSPFGPMPRRQAVELMSEGSAFLAD